MLLGKIADRHVDPDLDFTLGRCLHTSQAPQQARLPGAVAADDDDPVPAAGVEVDIFEHCGRSVADLHPGGPERYLRRSLRGGQAEY